MGLSASQARFLQLTARKSDVEYRAQQISQRRLEWAAKLEQASDEYQAAINNRKMVFSYNNGSEITSMDVTYANYKNYMNQQIDDTNTTQDRYYLVSSSGTKVVVNSAEDKATMMSKNRDLKDEDFLIVDGLDDVDNFQRAIQEGIYYFATMEKDIDGNWGFKTQSWEALGNGAIKEEYDRADDAAAEAKFQSTEAKIQNIDKKLELELDKLETERNAIQTEMDSVKKVVEDNVEKTFQIFS